MFSQIKDRKHIEQNFHSVARVMPGEGGFRMLGGVKNLSWGFVMAPHRLRTLVFYAILSASILFIFVSAEGSDKTALMYRLALNI